MFWPDVKNDRHGANHFRWFRRIMNLLLYGSSQRCMLTKGCQEGRVEIRFLCALPVIARKQHGADDDNRNQRAKTHMSHCQPKEAVLFRERSWCDCLNARFSSMAGIYKRSRKDSTTGRSPPAACTRSSILLPTGPISLPASSS